MQTLRRNLIAALYSYINGYDGPDTNELDKVHELLNTMTGGGVKADADPPEGPLGN